MTAMWFSGSHINPSTGSRGIGPSRMGSMIPKKINKKSVVGDVAPAGIKSYKFLFVLKKIYFAVFEQCTK